MTLIREVDGAAFLERQGRFRVALAQLDAEAMADILDEIEPFPLEVGRRYRLRVLAGEPDAVRVAHVADEAGNEYHLEHPIATAPTYREVDGVMVSRVYGLPGRRSPGSIVLQLDDGQAALLADIDVLAAWSLA